MGMFQKIVYISAEGQRAKSKEQKAKSKEQDVFFLPYALCSMPYALCPMPYALCPMPYAIMSTNFWENLEHAQYHIVFLQGHFWLPLRFYKNLSRIHPTKKNRRTGCLGHLQLLKWFSWLVALQDSKQLFKLLSNAEARLLFFLFSFFYLFGAVKNRREGAEWQG